MNSERDIIERTVYLSIFIMVTAIWIMVNTVVIGCVPTGWACLVASGSSFVAGRVYQWLKERL
jgi:hypothetical protein